MGERLPGSIASVFVVRATGPTELLVDRARSRSATAVGDLSAAGPHPTPVRGGGHFRVL
ncbi:hypothetical protein ACRBEV_10720 [Methylobacterium phyllosphaerae]